MASPSTMLSPCHPPARKATLRIGENFATTAAYGRPSVSPSHRNLVATSAAHTTGGNSVLFAGGSSMAPFARRYHRTNASLALYASLIHVIHAGATTTLACPEPTPTTVAEASPSPSASPAPSPTELPTAIATADTTWEIGADPGPTDTAAELVTQAPTGEPFADATPDSTFAATGSPSGLPTPTASAPAVDAPWAKVDGDNEGALAQFLEAFNRFRSGPFTGIGAVAHFETSGPALGPLMTDTWDLWVPTEPRLDDMFEVFLGALRTVEGASDSSRKYFAKTTYRFLVENHPSSSRADRLFLYMLNEEMDRTGGAERFCAVYSRPSRAEVSALLQPMLSTIVPQRLAAEYLFKGARIARCLYAWTKDSGPNGYQDAFTIAATGLARGDTDWLSVITDFLNELTDEEPSWMLDDLGVMTGVAVIATTRSDSSGAAATIIARSRTASATHWPAVIAGLINNSVIDVSVPHLSALLTISASYPELNAQLKSASLTALDIPEMPATYYLALGLFVATLD